MIRGSIEVVKRSHVAGWIYTEAEPVLDRMILAFANGRCVGAGKVGLFRQDLLDAKLGDGRCGFEFPIMLNDDDKLGAVIIKLQNSDVALIQQTSILTGPDDEDGADDGSVMTPGRLAWLRDRGWLDQHEHDFLRAVQTVGAYERGLRPPRRGTAEAVVTMKPEQIAYDLFSLYALGEVEISRTKIASISDLPDMVRSRSKGEVPLMAFWSGSRCQIALEEQAQAPRLAGQGSIVSVPAPGAVEYAFGPDRLLFVHRNTSFAPHGAAPADGIIVFTAAERSALAVMPVLRKGAAA